MTPRRLSALISSPAISLVAVVVAAGFVLRLQGLGWDGWSAFHPDERNLVTAAAALSFPDRLIPGFHAYNGLSLWLPKILGSLVNPGCTEAACLIWPARALSAVLGGGAVWLGALICRRLGGQAAMLLGALLLAFSSPLLQWAHFGTTESALVFVTLGLWLQAIRYVSGDDAQRTGLVWGLLLGFGLGMKTSAAAMALIPIVACIYPWRGLARAVLALATAALVSGILLVVTTPAIVVIPHEYFSVMRSEGGIVAGTSDVPWTWQFIGRRDGLFEIAQLWGMLDYGVFLMAVGGGALLVVRQRLATLPALVFTIVYLALIFTWHAKFARYLAPVVPVLLIFAAIAAGALLERVPSISVRLVTALAIGFATVSGLSTALGYQATDPRLQAADALRDRLRTGDLVLIEPNEIGVFRFEGGRARILSEAQVTGVSHRAELAASLAEARWMILYSRRHWSVLPRLHEKFPNACSYYAGLVSGALGYSVVARFRRQVPLGALLTPGLGAEETRVVFDRPTVYLLENTKGRSAAELAARLRVPPDQEACRPAAIAAELDRTR